MTAAAVPALEMPGVREVSHALRALANPSKEKSAARAGIVVCPMTIAPASRRRVITG